MSRVKDQYHDEICAAAQCEETVISDLYGGKPFAVNVTEILARRNAALLAASRRIREERKARKARLAVRFGRAF